MQTIAVVSQKGGAGKTTLAVHIAVAGQQKGLASGVVDLDPQASARKWGLRRNGSPEVVSGHAEMLSDLMKTARENGADLLVIDTPPAIDRTALIAVRAADLVLVPVQLSVIDLEAIAATLDLAKIAQKPAWVVFNRVPARSGSALDDARRGLKAGDVQIADMVVHDRAAFRHGMIDGQTALEFDSSGKAAEEIRNLFTWLCGHSGTGAFRQQVTRARKLSRAEA